VAIEGNYVEGEEEGIWKEYYYNGRLANSGKYLNGEKDSVWNFYYPNEKLSSSIPYKDDEPHGEARYFSPEGLPLLDKLYDHGGILSYRLVDASGEPGPWIKFSGSGKISVANSAGTVVFEETYRDGLRDGDKKLYFDNGKPCEEYQYNLGNRHGIVAMYYANGKLCEKGTYRNGEPDGKFEHYTEAGLLEKIEIYKMGSRHGKAIFSVKGAKTQEILFWDAIMED
jgi:antitoxin component YwqK of YwqJK toxin-antitoxin module